MNINTLYITLRETGVVRSQYEFSELCGRKKTWFSSIKCRAMPITRTALHSLARNLAIRAQSYPQRQIDCAIVSAQVRQLLVQRTATRS